MQVFHNSRKYIKNFMCQGCISYSDLRPQILLYSLSKFSYQGLDIVNQGIDELLISGRN